MPSDPVPEPHDAGDLERQLRRWGPWGASVAVHAVLVLLGLLLSWTVAMVRDDAPPVRVSADFEATEWEPVARTAEALAEVAPAPDPALAPLPDVPAPEEPVDELLDFDALAPAPAPVTAPPASDPAPPPAGTATQASFAGVSTTNARRIVYVIDASGSMLPTFDHVVAFLGESLVRLDPAQEFAIVFFQQNRAVPVPPVGRLGPARPDRVAQAMAWIEDSVAPRGRSNPLAALEMALGLEPDAVFLLSEDVTGSGEFEVDQAELLARLDALNPVDPRNGVRRTTIACIQFLDPDPLRTLERIAELHGGPQGYKLLDRAELGLARP